MEQLYDMSTDLAQRGNLADENTAVVKDLQDRLGLILESNQTPTSEIGASRLVPRTRGT